MTRIVRITGEKRKWARVLAIVPLALMAAACQPQPAAEQLPTNTLAPLVTLTPRATATPEISRTPLPTLTFTPSITPVPPTATTTLTPSPTPPIMGIVSSLQTVNVRRGPGASFGAFEALFPGTEVQVIGVDESGRWLNVKLEDGREGWINTPLVRIDPTATPLATFTLPPDQTAAAGGTPLPTALIGGGAVTATPALDLPDMPPTSTLEGQAGTPNLPIIDFDPINATSTALAAVLGTSEPSATPSGPTPEPGAPTETHAPIPTNSGPIAAPTTSGEPEVQTGVDLYVNCDNPPRGLLRAPSNLAAGSTAEIYWYWYARTEEQIQQHMNTAQYTISINGQEIRKPLEYAKPVRRQGTDYVVDFFYPTGELDAGTYAIDFHVTWSEQIYDGYNYFGPGTRNLEETGTCTFVVR
ncbi:MAG: SH3 domain-containing protein [Anaerolineae bacterium]|nr:SH3 domain-containing protein [Anaerolineae bacterium]